MRGCRVLFVTAALNVGGAERQWALLIPRLRSIGFDISVLTLLGKGKFYDELERAGTPIRTAQLKGRTDVIGMRRALALAGHPDVVVTQTVAAHVLGSMIATRLRRPHVAIEHHPPGLSRRPHELALLRPVAPRVDAVVGVTPGQVPELVRLGYRRDRIRIIPNGIRTVGPNRSRRDVRADFGLTDDDFVALFVATLRPQKHPEMFIDAVASAHAVDSKIRGLIAGGGPGFERVRSYATSTRGVVEVLGERSDTVELMNAADVVCLSSRAEGLPLVLLEAMALAKPVVATDVGGVGDAVVSGVTGVLTRSGDTQGFRDALVRLAAHPSLCARYGEAAKARQITHFSVGRMAERYALLLDSIARRTRELPGFDPSAAGRRAPATETGCSASIGLIGPLPPQIGGVTTFIRWLFDHQTEIGVRYEGFDLWRPVGDETGGRLRRSTLPRQVRLFLRYLAWLPGAPSVIHLCASINSLSLPREIIFASLARVAGRRVVTHVHQASELERAATSRPRRAGLRLLARASDDVVAIAPTCERWLNELGISAVHVFNPVGLWPVTARVSRARNGVELLAVGAYGRAKGSFDLVAALALVRSRGANVQLRLIGKELRRGEEKQLRDHIRSLALEGSVSIDGIADPEQLAERYTDAAIFCLPSHREGLPMTILEAMAFGLPVISTRVGAIADVVEDGVTGVLLKPGDVPGLAAAIERLAEDERLRASLGTNGAARVARIAADEKIEEEWRRIYRSVVRDQGSRRSSSPLRVSARKER